MKKKRWMVSKFGLHMASDPLTHEDITEEAMVEIAESFSLEADLNGGSVQCALANFIYTLLVQRADSEYVIDERGAPELVAGISRLAEEMAARALRDMDATLSEFYDPERGDIFEGVMRVRGRRSLEEDAARARLFEQAGEKRAKAAAQRQAQKDAQKPA